VPLALEKLALFVFAHLLASLLDHTTHVTSFFEAANDSALGSSSEIVTASPHSRIRFRDPKIRRRFWSAERLSLEFRIGGHAKRTHRTDLRVAEGSNGSE
jgi:hypothetical protein